MDRELLRRFVQLYETHDHDDCGSYYYDDYHEHYDDYDHDDYDSYYYDDDHYDHYDYDSH